MGKLNFYKAEKNVSEIITGTWKILIADDEEDVHILTKTVLKNFVYKNKTLEFISAYNSEQTLNVLKNNDDIVLILLDVIMESDDAGLRVVKDIRENLNNQYIQIVLRTGQAGLVPETEVVMNYAINDYKEKTELTSKKLITTIVTALRSYENIRALNDSKTQIEFLNSDLNKLVESLDKNVIACKVDENANLRYVSSAFCKAFGYRKEELIGNSKSMLIHPDFDKEVLQDLQDAYKNKKVWHGEVMYRTKSGKTLWANVKRSFELVDTHIDSLDFTSVLFDITNQKEIESLNYELNRLLSSFDDYVIASRADIDGNILYVSKAFSDISGYRKDELIGQKHNVVKDRHYDEKVYKKLWETITSNKVWTGEVKNKKKDGEIYWLRTIISPEYNLKGEFLHYTAISQDITAQKDIERANSEIELLNEEIIDTQKEVVFRLGAIAEARSKETGMHVKRVAEYSKLLALYYGLSNNESEIVKMASPMHDIGKVAIPDNILNKPGKFTPEEFEIMKTHSQIGYEMLKSSSKTILKAAAIIAHQHQEKYDGSGYPQGLRGEDIHIYGRITAIADVFDALGSDRVYKKAWDDERIFNMFKEEKGKHFDPILINIFFKNIDKFLEIRDSLKDI
jgi:PAS domain S-box-containing protein